MKYCIAQLFESFLKHFYAFKHDNLIEDSVYDFHYEAIIEFIENIGSSYDEIGEKEKEAKQVPYSYNTVEAHILAILKLTEKPEPKTIEQIEHFNGDENFKLLESISAAFIRQNHPRLSALLQNLVERRKNKWEKHLSAADGPKRLKEIQEDILREDEDVNSKSKGTKEKLEQEKLEKAVKELFQAWENDKKEEIREIHEIIRKFK